MAELFAGWKKEANKEEEEKPTPEAKPEEVAEETPEEAVVETVEEEEVAVETSEEETPVEETEKPLPTPVVELRESKEIGIATPSLVRPEPEPVQEDASFGVISALPEEEYVTKSVVTVYGLKGDGKTTVAFNFSGEILCISFDRKSMRIKPMVPDPKRIHVFDLMKYVDYTDTEKYGRALKIVFDETMKLLQGYQTPVDWVVIDGMDVLARIAESVMRWKYGIGMTDGIKNFSVWKYRRFVLKQVHNAALTIAKKGIIYTTYVDKDQTMEGQQIIDSKDVPKWLDVMMMETDHVFRVKVENGQYILILESGKGIASQRKWDITGDKIQEVIKDFESKL